MSALEKKQKRFGRVEAQLCQLHKHIKKDAAKTRLAAIERGFSACKAAFDALVAAHRREVSARASRGIVHDEAIHSLLSEVHRLQQALARKEDPRLLTSFPACLDLGNQWQPFVAREDASSDQVFIGREIVRPRYKRRNPRPTREK